MLCERDLALELAIVCRRHVHVIWSSIVFSSKISGQRYHYKIPSTKSHSIHSSLKFSFEIPIFKKELCFKSLHLFQFFTLKIYMQLCSDSYKFVLAEIIDERGPIN